VVDWESNSITILFICGHAFLYFVALLITFRPRLTVFHLFLATQFVAFVVRPILAVQERFFLYQVPDGWRLYNLGLLLQLIATLFFVGGYLLGLLIKNRGFLPASRKSRFVIPLTFFRGMVFSLVLGVFSVTLIHVFSSGLWLPSARSQALTAVVPFGKVLFGMAVIPLSFSFTVSLYFLWNRRRIISLHGVLSLASLLLSGLLLILLYQRGFLLMGFIVFIFLLDRVGAITYGRLVSFAGIGLILLIFARPVALLVATGQMPEMRAGLKHYLLYQPNFDNPDVWPVVITFVKKDGLLNGQTFLAIPLRFASPLVRREWNILTAVDVLNFFYEGSFYWETRFGFNVSLPQELFLNFGWLGLFFTVFAGIVTAWVDIWLWRVYPRRVFLMYAVFASFFTGGFMGELGGTLQWTLAYITFGLVVDWLSRIRRGA
jgi:hypothetical protein